MQCIKCGKETQENQVFCESCLQVMDAYPVKPDTAIHLPNRANQPSSKKSARKKALPLEEQVANMKKSIRRLRLFSIVLALLLIFVSCALVYRMTRPQQQEDPVSKKNYTFNSETTTATDPEPTTATVPVPTTPAEPAPTTTAE